MKAARLILVQSLLLFFAVVAHAQGYNVDNWNETITLRSDATFDQRAPRLTLRTAPDPADRCRSALDTAER